MTARLKYTGQERKLRGSGGCPIEAFVCLLSECMGLSLEICDYSQHGTLAGASARASAYVALRVGEATRYGAGEHEDVVVASLRAIVSACNRCRPAVLVRPRP